MEAWVPLFDIFMNSPSPESEASLWLHHSFAASSSAAIPTTTASFVSFLMKPLDAIVVHKGSSSSSHNSSRRCVIAISVCFFFGLLIPKFVWSIDLLTTSFNIRVLFLQTLPNMVQGRILSFLAVERQRFCRRDLCRLARSVLSCDWGLDFWVERAARNLFDVLSDSSYEWISSLGLDSGEEDRVVDEFESVPGWLEDNAGAGNLFPWLPVLDEDLIRPRMLFGDSGKNLDALSDERNRVEESMDEDLNEVEVEIACPVVDPLGPEVLDEVANLKAQIMSFESSTKTVDLAREIRKLCCDNKRGDSLVVLGLIEPWLADDETTSILISHLSDESEEDPVWSSQVLCSIVLPKLLVLEEPVSRVVLAATVKFCKVHQKAAEYGLLLPLILHKDGINNPICDVITKIVKECLHTTHVSSVCQKLLCGGKDERRPVCLPCHQCLVSDELVWTESLFSLFQNILNHNLCLTQDSIDRIVYQVQHNSEKLSKSLKFGSFLLCLVTKCSPLLQSHKLRLIEAVGRTNTLLTKSTLSKLTDI